MIMIYDAWQDQKDTTMHLYYWYNMWGCLHVINMQDTILFDNFNYQKPCWILICSAVMIAKDDIISIFGILSFF